MAPADRVGQARKKPRVESAVSTSLETSLVLLKVSVALVGWLAVFLMTFLGYLTLPAVVLFGFLVVYMAIDLVGRWMRRARAG